MGLYMRCQNLNAISNVVSNRVACIVKPAVARVEQRPILGLSKSGTLLEQDGMSESSLYQLPLILTALSHVS